MAVIWVFRAPTPIFATPGGASVHQLEPRWIWIFLFFFFPVEEADEMLIKCEGGIDAALEYAKMWCKYVKELLNWIEKRLSYGESGCTVPAGSPYTAW